MSFEQGGGEREYVMSFTGMSTAGREWNGMEVIHSLDGTIGRPERDGIGSVEAIAR